MESYIHGQAASGPVNEGMSKRTKGALLVIAVIIVSIVIFFAVRSGSPLDDSGMTGMNGTDANGSKDSQGSSAEDARLAAEQCAKDTAAQQEYLAKETFSKTYTFDAYPVPLPRYAGLRGLDPNSSSFAAGFKTKIDQELAKPENKAPNFAGYYSIVSVGMTGWGENYWIIDRRTGEAYEFPYHAQSLEFKQDSKLLIMNSKESIQDILIEHMIAGAGDDARPHCDYLNQELVTDLRPFYFEWRDGILVLLAPTDIRPAVNGFWVEYFGDVDGTNQDASEPLAYFVRSVRKAYIAHMGWVPHDGYSGYIIYETFGGIEPVDFAGIKTNYGEYWVTSSGGLQYTGNAPSNAEAMTAEGMGMLLQNISKRLSLPIATTEEVDALLQVISKKR